MTHSKQRASAMRATGAVADDVRSLAEFPAVRVDDRMSGAEHPVQWRSISRGLWVGRSNDLPVGVIEKGRRYAVTDADGEIRGRYRRLDQAMHAFEPVAESELDAVAAPSWEGAALAASIAGAAAVLLATYGMLVLV